MPPRFFEIFQKNFLTTLSRLIAQVKSFLNGNWNSRKVKMISLCGMTMLGGFGIEPSHTQRVENSYAKDAGGKTSEAVDYTPTF
jgi:hypothetical protein